MDPEACFKLVTDESLDLSERGQAATDLLSWMALGGGTPDVAGVRATLMATHVVEQCKIVLAKVLDHMEGEDERRDQAVDDAVYEHEAGDDL